MSTSVAFGPEGTIAAGYGLGVHGPGGGVVLFDAKGERLRHDAAGGQGGRCHERGLRAGGHHRRGIWPWRPRPGGGVVLFDAKGERLRHAAGGQGGRCHERGLRAGRHHRRGI